MNYLSQRLREPGTIRSLAVVLFGLRSFLPERLGFTGMSVDEIQSFIEAAIVILGIYSAAMPEQTTKAVEKITDAAADVATVSAEVAALRRAIR